MATAAVETWVTAMGVDVALEAMDMAPAMEAMAMATAAHFTMEDLDSPASTETLY